MPAMDTVAIVDDELGGPRMTGVMADEVAKLRPWALGPKIGAYRTVNYQALEAA
jgi:hypothetical protein